MVDLSPSDPWGLRDYVKLENMLNPPDVSNGWVISEVFFSIPQTNVSNHFPQLFTFSMFEIFRLLISTVVKREKYSLRCSKGSKF